MQYFPDCSPHFFPSYLFLPQSGLSLCFIQLQLLADVGWGFKEPCRQDRSLWASAGLKVWKGVRIPTALVVWITREWFVKAQPGATGTNPPALLHNFPPFPKFTEFRQWLREKATAQSQSSSVQHPQPLFSILTPALQGGQDRNAPFPQPLLSSRKSSVSPTSSLTLTMRLECFPCNS